MDVLQGLLESGPIRHGVGPAGLLDDLDPLLIQLGRQLGGQHSGLLGRFLENLPLLVVEALPQLFADEPAGDLIGVVGGRPVLGHLVELEGHGQVKAVVLALDDPLLEAHVDLGHGQRGTLDPHGPEGVQKDIDTRDTQLHPLQVGRLLDGPFGGLDRPGGAGPVGPEDPDPGRLGQAVVKLGEDRLVENAHGLVLVVKEVGDIEDVNGLGLLLEVEGRAQPEVAHVYTAQLHPDQGLGDVAQLPVGVGQNLDPAVGLGLDNAGELLHGLVPVAARGRDGVDLQLARAGGQGRH